MKFSICIGAVRAGSIEATIRSVCRQTWTDWELMIVGQGDDSTLRTVVERAAQGDPRVQYMHLERRGATIACNAGIQATTGEIVALLDDDCEACPDWLETLAGYFTRYPEVGVISGSLIAPPPARRGFAVCPAIEPDEVLYDPTATNRQPPPGWGWVSANVAIRRSVIEQVGLLDEHLGPGTRFPAADDSDYLLRLELHGIKMLSTPRAVVHHTYGYRYGFQAVFNHARNYAIGNGALAAKLTLLGDPRGREWLAKDIRESTIGVVRSLQVHKLPLSLLRLWYFVRSYQQCLCEYRADPVSWTLYPASSVPQAAPRSFSTAHTGEATRRVHAGKNKTWTSVFSVSPWLMPVASWCTTLCEYLR